MKELELAKNPRRVLGQLRALAQARDVNALSALATIYENGSFDQDHRLIVPPNLRVARQYEQRAATAGNPESMTAIADRLSRKDFERARRLYETAFALGYSTAAYNLACAYQGQARYAAAVKWFHHASQAGDVSALLPLARAELYGLGTRRNVSAAFKKLKRLAASKVTMHPSNWLQCEALEIMADVLISGWPRPRDLNAGIRCLRRAAALGSRTARVRLEEFE